MADRAAPRWRAVAVDDEPPALERLRTLLREAPAFELVAAYDDPAQAVAELRRSPPDVLFLDIQMPGLSGFDVVRALGDAAPLVVFVTAYDEHAIRAFEVSAVDYLLKPIHRERLAHTLERVAERLAGAPRPELGAQVAEVVRGLQAALPAAPLRIALKLRDRHLLLDPATIDRVDADGNLLHVQVGQERHAIRETLTAFGERLPAGMFVRVNRSTLVNVARVRQVEPWFNGDFVLVLADGARVTSGRSYRERLRAALGL